MKSNVLGWTKAASVAMVAFACLVLAYAYLYNVPLEGLSAVMPKPASLAHLDAPGCGLSTTSHASTTKFFSTSKLDPKTRETVIKEMSSMPGYVRSEDSHGVAFRKRHGGFMPVTSAVLVLKSGGIAISAMRSKW